MPHLAPQQARAHPQEQAFLRAIAENPHDEALWLILADWLDEHEDSPRAELLRLHRQMIATCCEQEQHPERATQQACMLDLLAGGVRPCLPRQTVRLASGIEMAFHFIPAGSFLMGSPEGEKERSDDETQHRVTLTQAFWLAVTPVTQAQWEALMGSNPSYIKGEDHPVEGVSYYDCQEFCLRLGEQVGESVRLPSEAEWEYACRAGTTTPFFFGEALRTWQANHAGYPGPRDGKEIVYRQQTTAVGSFLPNAWGLFDMHGNVWEWCSDWLAAYGKGTLEDPWGPARGTKRILRGGSWANAPHSCRSANRDWLAPAIRSHSGFRPAFHV
jgi:uncharacterized protein (TIGR02996 family)